MWFRRLAHRDDGQDLLGAVGGLQDRLSGRLAGDGHGGADGGADGRDVRVGDAPAGVGGLAARGGGRGHVLSGVLGDGDVGVIQREGGHGGGRVGDDGVDALLVVAADLAADADQEGVDVRIVQRVVHAVEHLHLTEGAGEGLALPGEAGGLVGRGAVGALGLVGAVSGEAKDGGADHDLEAVEHAHDAALDVGRGEEADGLALGHALQQLLVHVRVEQEESVGLRDVVGVEAELQRGDVGRDDLLAETGGGRGPGRNAASGGEDAVVAVRAPVAQHGLGGSLDEGLAVLVDDAVPLVVGQLDGVGIRDLDRVGGQLVQGVLDILVRAGVDRCRIGVAVENDAARGAGVRDVNLLALVDINVIVDRLREEEVVGKEALDDGPLPDFFLYCHSG